MSLGNSRTRNWGKDAQQVALDLQLAHSSVAYQLRPLKSQDGKRRLSLWLAPSRNGVTLPFVFGSCADLVNTRRGSWAATHPFDGRILASGVSLRDVVRSAIRVVYC